MRKKNGKVSEIFQLLDKIKAELNALDRKPTTAEIRERMKPFNEMMRARLKKEKRTRILSIDMGDNYDAWYKCSDGHTYYDCMYSWSTKVGDYVNPDNLVMC